MNYEILEEKQTIIEVEKSKFISIVKNVKNPAEVDSFLKNLKKEHQKARHICYAYKIGNIIKFSDDGEPSGTAGKPILNLIEVSNLNNIIIFVIRYFGGTLLGSGRLLRTYAASAKKVIDESKLVEVEECNKVTLECSYDIYDEVSYFLKNMHFTIIKINFNDNIIIEFFEPLDFKENLEERFYPKVKVSYKEKTSRIKE